MTETAAKRSREEIEAILVRHTGSLKRYRHWTGRFIYTPGVRDLAELCACQRRMNSPQKWRLKIPHFVTVQSRP
jgi:hypothetical protein